MEIAEVRIDYYDVRKKHWCVDIWYIEYNPNEGETVATIDDNGNVEWYNEQAKGNEMIQNKIETFLAEMKIKSKGRFSSSFSCKYQVNLL